MVSCQREVEAYLAEPPEVAADQEQRLAAGLSNRLGGEVRAPALAEFGFEPVGGRLLPAA
jgi:anti-sigma factor RsiW